MKTTECHNCHRSSKETDGWWSVQELLRTYHLCPRCYRNRSLLAYRDTLLEAITELDTKDDDRSVTAAMNVMKIRCLQVIRDTRIND
tara:strand:- start:162 stop:422 length:261 start_codon:yes stop_codon:yes gene_type:complete